MAWGFLREIRKKHENIITKTIREKQTKLNSVTNNIMWSRTYFMLLFEYYWRNLTSKHMLFASRLTLFYPEPLDITNNINFHSKKINNIKSLLGTMEKRMFKYTTRKPQISSPSHNRTTISLNEVLLIEEKKEPRSTWRRNLPGSSRLEYQNQTLP